MFIIDNRKYAIQEHLQGRRITESSILTDEVILKFDDDSTMTISVNIYDDMDVKITG